MPVSFYNPHNIICAVCVLRYLNRLVFTSISNRSGFFIQRNTLKASTIENFKGLEAKNIIYQINSPHENDELEEYFTRIYTGLSRLASIADLDESTGQYFSGIHVICSEPMFLEYSKSWQNFKSNPSLPDF